MSGAIPLLPLVCLHGVDKESCTFFLFDDTNPNMAAQWTALTTAWLMFMASSSELFGGCIKINMEAFNGHRSCK